MQLVSLVGLRSRFWGRCALVLGGALVAALYGLAVAAPASAATLIPTTTYALSTTWNAAGSPYVINGDVTVASGATLTIDPGVVVKFSHQPVTPKKIVVASGGVLSAIGTQTNPVTITGIKDDTVAGDTGGDGPTTCGANQGGVIEVQSASALNEISHAVLRCGPYAGGSNTFIRVTAGSALRVTDTTISQLNNTGIHVTGGSVVVERTTITDPSSNGIHLLSGSTAAVDELSVVGAPNRTQWGMRIENSTVSVMRSTFRLLDRGIGVILNSSMAGGASSFWGNDIYDNEDIGVYVSSGSSNTLAQMPYGHRNNIYNNGGATPNGNQLSVGNPSGYGMDWSYNYWGPSAYWQQNPGGCARSGYFAYPGSNPASNPANVLSPVSSGRTIESQPFPQPSVYCGKNDPSIGVMIGWSIAPFDQGGGGAFATAGETMGGAANAFRDGVAAFASDPVATATGNFVHQETDLKLGGSGIPFKLVRSYNSLETTAGVLGRGWTFNLAAALTIGPGGDVTFRSEDGATFFFKKEANGSYTGSPVFRGSLEAIPGGYRATTREGDRYEFDSSGKLVSLKDRNGLGLTLAYSSGVLSTATDAAGRIVTFTYTSGKLSSVSLPGGRSVTYAYNSVGLLASVTDARGKTWTYSYDGQRLLTKLTDPLGHDQFTNVYSTTNGRVTDQYDALNNHSTFAWNTATQTATTTDPLGKQTVDVFDHNLLVSRTDPLGHTIAFTYDDAGNVASRTDARGNTTTYTHDGRGNKLTETAPAPLSFTQTWTYNPDDQPATYVNGRGKTWSYGYDGAGNLTSVTAPGAKTTTYAWSGGRLQSTIDRRNKTTSYGYDSDGNLASVTDPLGNVHSYGYDSSGRLTSSTDPRGNASGATLADYTTTFAYDNADHRTSVTDPYNHATAFAYDNAGRLASTTNALNKTWTYAYNNANELVTVTAPNSSTQTRSYTVRGELASETSAAGRTTSYAYDDAGRLASKVSPRGNASGANPADYTTSYGYDNDGNLTSITDPLGHVKAIGYDALSRRTSLTDALSHTTSYGYDNAGNLTAVTDPLSHTTGYGYNDRDELVSTTDGRGKTWTYGLDDVGNLLTLTDPLGKVRSFSYDNAGRRTAMVDPRGNAPGATAADYTTSYGYDAAGRLTSTTDPLGHSETRTYDRNGRLKSVTDPRSNAITYSYDALGRLTTVTAPDTSTTGYGYDNNTNDLTSRTDANLHTTSYGYNLDHEPTSVTNPLGKVWNYSYDPDGNLVEQIDAVANAASNPALGTTSYTIDRAGRPSAINYSDATPDVSFGYDNADRLTTVTDGAGTKTIGYDNANRVTATTRGGSGFAYAYDNANNLTQTTYPDTTVISYGYDDASQLTTLTQGTDSASYGYDPAGYLTTRTLPNGIVETLDYDRAGRLSFIAAADGTTQLTSYTVARDNAANPTSVTKLGGDVETYAYDNFNRLTSVCYQASCPNAGDPKISWTYDSIGRRQTETRPGSTLTYTYNNADQLTSTSNGTTTTTYSYDANGRQTGKGSDTFAYDMAGRLTSTTAAGITTNYSYDSNGNRLTATSGGATTNYSWDENPLAGLPQLASETDSSGTLLRRYLNDQHGALALQDPTGTFPYLRDQADSNAALTDSAAAPAWTYAYEPFGAATATQVDPAAPDNPLQFNGQYLDPTTDLYNLRARQYNPTDGRFTTTDSLASPITDPYINPYTYANNQPTLLSDPSGLRPGLNDLRHIGGTALDLVGETIEFGWDITVGAGIQMAQDAQTCAAGVLAGEARGATRECIKTAINVGLIAIPGGYFAWEARVAIKQSFIRLALEQRGAIGNVVREVNAAGHAYPKVLDLRTGKPIPHPGSGLLRVPKGERVPWGREERGAYIKAWYDRGFKTPEGGWAEYDIHHIRPREYGGTNTFENLTPVRRGTHQADFNAWWRGY